MIAFKNNKIIKYDEQNDIIRVTWTKDMTPEDFDIYERGITDNKSFNDSLDRLRVLVDLSKFQSMPNESQRRRVLNIIENLLPDIEDEKTAVIGLGRVSSIAVNAILIVTGRSDMKIYSNREDAIKWLKE